MKKVFFVIGSLLILSSAYVEDAPVYSFKITPLQDTLLVDYDNTLQTLKNGLPFKDYPFDFKMTNVIGQQSTGVRGVWVLHPVVNDSSNFATMEVTKDEKVILKKEIVIIPITGDLKKRIRSIEKVNEKK